MPNRRARRSQVIRGLIGAAAIVLAAVIVWALLVPGTDWLARHDISAAKGSLATARDAARGRLLTLGAGLLAAGALVFTARNFTLSREGQVTDRYTKAVEQLGSDKLDVRIGGIYALERVARDSARDHATVMEVLTAFIREHSREPWPVDSNGAQQGEKKTRPDVQAAVTVAGRRDAKRDILPIDLADANLTRANLSGADLSGADLGDVNLAGANLAGANLTYARLTRANLADADLGGANLGGANLGGADLGGAYLTAAYLTYADLSGARLTGARLSGARLTGADLGGADLVAALTGARLTGADLGGADLGGVNLAVADLTDADLTDADLTDARWPVGVPVPDGWIVDSTSSRLKRAGQLSEVTAHYFW